MNMGFTLQQPEHLFWLIATPAAFVLALLSAMFGRVALRRMYGAAAGRIWARGTPWIKHVASGVLLSGALALVVIATARPGSDPTPKQTVKSGRDVLFLVDVSRSMLAADVRPNRLERAKLLMHDVLDVAEGDRIGVIAFAGAAVSKCPLTTDYSFARMSIDDLSPDTVSRGGTAIGDAIRVAMGQLFPDGKQSTDDGRTKTIFLISDGEDHESEPIAAAKDAGEKSVRIVSIGLGSEIAGAPVPASGGSEQGVKPSGFMQHGGATVTSRLDTTTLKEVAQATPGGVFLNVGTGNVDLDDVYLRLMKSVRRGSAEKSDDDATAMRYTEWFQVFVLGALALLAMEGLLHVPFRSGVRSLAR